MKRIATVEVADMVPEGWQMWHRFCAEIVPGRDADLLAADHDHLLGLASVVAGGWAGAH